MEQTKPNTPKAHIHQSKEMYYNTKQTQNTKARFSRLLWHPAWKQRRPILLFQRFINLSLTYLTLTTYQPRDPYRENNMSDMTASMSIGQPHHCELATPHILQLYQCCYQYSSQWTQTNLTTRPCPAVLNAWLSSAARRRRRRRCNSFSVSSSLRTAIGTASLPVPPGCSSTAYHTHVQLVNWLDIKLHQHAIQSQVQVDRISVSDLVPNVVYLWLSANVHLWPDADFRLLAWLSDSAFSELHSVTAKCNW